jgi:DHA1 family bicyclomycin/chloramphenicol resistance-like MFS transporter
MFLPILLLATVALMIAGIDIYLPCMPHMTDHFQTTEFMMQLSIMATTVSSALFSLFWGRYCDTHGRRRPILLALALYGFGAYLCTLPSNMELFLAARFIQAIGGGGLSVLTIVILSDLYHGPRYAQFLAIYGLMFPAVFALAPLLGAQIFIRSGWQTNFHFIAILATIFFIAFYFKLPETLKKESIEKAKHQSLKTIVKLFMDVDFMRYGLGHALPISISILFTANSAFIFVNHFQFTPVEYSIAQAIPVLFNFAGALLYSKYVTKFGLYKFIRLGAMTCGFFSSFIIPIILFRIDSPIIILCAMSWFMAFLSCTVASCATKAYESKPDDRGLAVAVVTLLRNTLASISVISCGFFINGTIYPMLIFMCIIGYIIFALLRKSPVTIENGI